MLASVDIEIADQVREGELLRYSVEQTRVLEGLSRFTVQAFIETQIVARGTIVGSTSRGNFMTRYSDVMIIGGGLAGLTLAIQLRQTLPMRSVTVLERQRHPVPETTFKVGESMVEVSSWYLRETLGLGDYLLASHLPKFGLRFFMSELDNRDLGVRPEYGLLRVPEDIPNKPNTNLPGIHLPTYNVDRGRLENYLLERCREFGVEVIEGCKVKNLNLGNPHELVTDTSISNSKLRSRWVIDATGRAGFLARQLKLRRSQGHEVNAAWFRLNGRIDPDCWTANVAYHNRTRPHLRWLSTSHLMGEGYWIWLIPLPTGATSVGIMTDPAQYSFDRLNRFEKVLTWLRAREPQLAEVTSSLEHLDFRAMIARSYLSRRSLSTDRWALCGESAFFLDALYSPGGDFIAVGNTLITQMIEADYTANRLQLAILAKFGEELLNGMFRHYFGLYHGNYSLMGSPGVMLQKVAWDTAVYFAYNVLLFCNGRFCDAKFHQMIKKENALLDNLQQRMIHRFKRYETAKNSYAGHFIDQGCVESVHSLYRSSENHLADADALKVRLEENLKILESFSNTIEEIVQ